MSRIPPLRNLTLERLLKPSLERVSLLIDPLPDDIDQWLETAFDPTVEIEDLSAPLGDCLSPEMAGAE